MHAEKLKNIEYVLMCGIRFFLLLSFYFVLLLPLGNELLLWVEHII